MWCLQNVVRHAIQNKRQIEKQKIGAKAPFYYLSSLSNIFSGVDILQIPIIKSIKDHTAVIAIPYIVQVNKNINTPVHVLPA